MEGGETEGAEWGGSSGCGWWWGGRCEVEGGDVESVEGREGGDVGEDVGEACLGVEDCESVEVYQRVRIEECERRVHFAWTAGLEG